MSEPVNKHNNCVNNKFFAGLKTFTKYLASFFTDSLQKAEQLSILKNVTELKHWYSGFCNRHDYRLLYGVAQRNEFF